MTNGSGAELARRPDMLIERYAGEFGSMLPSHVPADLFVRVAVGALRRDPKLMAAAVSNPQSLISCLREAARLGLEPGTDEYWLVPRKLKGVVTVTGFEGWQGIVELIYRAGAASSVKAELVREADEFAFDPGTMDRPAHKVDWWRPRGQVLGAYAYAEMVGGGVSKVVVAGPDEIARAREASAGSDRPDSPWVTDYGAMVLKTAVRQLAKWVPTSAEYRREQLRAAVAVAAESAAGTTPVAMPAPAPAPPAPPVDLPPGVWMDGDGVMHEADDAEVVDQ